MSVTRWRSSMVLLGICVAAVLIGALRLVTQQAQEPPGSSASTSAEGAQALYTWMNDLGIQTTRFTSRAIGPDVSSFIILQPQALPAPEVRDAAARVSDRGGTLVLAGDSLQWVVTTRGLGVTVNPGPAAQHVTTPDGLSVPVVARFRLHADGAEPLLVADDGEPVALRVPRRAGALVVIASAEPLTNVGLRSDATARFVFRNVVAPTLGQSVAFDEIERLPASADASPATIDQLLFRTPVGLAVVYASLLTFVFLFLAGRRIGPALMGRSAAESQRTMYEHVQMLADLYRRAGRLTTVREAFSRHYARVRDPHGAAVLARIQSATTEADLISAVGDADDAR
jgi:uncharacterized protein DUF4350